MPLTWPFPYTPLATASCEGEKTPSEGLPLMKTARFLAGLPSSLDKWAPYRDLGFRRLANSQVTHMPTAIPKANCPVRSAYEATWVQSDATAKLIA